VSAPRRTVEMSTVAPAAHSPPPRVGEGPGLGGANPRRAGPRRRLALILTLCCALASAPGVAASRPAQPTAQLRIVHARPETAALGVLVDGQPVAALVFGRDSGYLILPSGPHSVALGPSGAAADAESTLAVDLVAGSLSTVVALPAPAVPLVLGDESLAPVGGPALVRLVNAAPAAPPAELTVGGAVATAPPVVSGAASAYAEVAGGTRPLVVRAADGGTPLASIPDATLGGDRAYTFILLGTPADTSPLSLLPLLDATAPGVPPLHSPANGLSGAPRQRD
jgi:hypothetical protein